VSPDETAFLLDLHLFLGKPIKFLQSSDNVSGSDISVVGRIPQDLVNEENGLLKAWMDTKADLVSFTCNKRCEDWKRSKAKKVICVIK